MQVQIGDKIKELRKRDKRTQEELASVLGVTAQAVSRWEANGCYPDMSIIPAIANYFHITIDELFGYNNDREAKITEYVRVSNDYLLNSDGASDDIIDILRKGLEEFPAEPRLMSQLSNMLYFKGFAEADKHNKYLEEAAELCKELCKTDSKYIGQLIHTYSLMGKYSMAEEIASKQPPINECREIMLAKVFDDERGNCYRGEELLSLLHFLGTEFNMAISWNEKAKNSMETIELIEAVCTVYEKLFAGTDYQDFSSDLCMLKLSCAKIAIKNKEYAQAVKYFEAAYEYFEKYDYILKGGPIKREIEFNSLLLKDLDSFPKETPIVLVRPEYLRDVVNDLPKKFRAKIEGNSRYEKII